MHVDPQAAYLFYSYINPLKPNDTYSGLTAPLTSKRCILYIFSTNKGTKYFIHSVYSPFFFPLQNAVCFIILTFGSCIIHILCTGVLKLKKKLRRQKVNIYLLTAIGLTPGGSSTVHIYTQTIHRTTQ